MLFKKAKLQLITLSAIAGIALISGCTSTYRAESTGQYIDSSVITATVKSRLFADPLVKGLPITVKTYKNTVQLSGFVNTRAERDRAKWIARNVDGVESVLDSLVVKRK